MTKPGKSNDQQRSEVQKAKKEGRSAGEAGVSTGAEKQRGSGGGKERGSRNTNET